MTCNSIIWFSRVFCLFTYVIKMLKLSLMWTMAHRHCYTSLLCWSTCLNFGIRSGEYCMSRSHCFFLSTYSLILLSPFQRLTQSCLEISNIWPRQLERIQGDVWAFCRKWDVWKRTVVNTSCSAVCKGAKYEVGKYCCFSVMILPAISD